ncbi:C1 family peptidase [Butyrivibrio sp. XPD2006]|uniref:C1 family peptidase n=1 Tax=Butyrivibrio sp. XPD2006 TaxID=1280668 RepID=UPI0003B6FC0D|nr:C1 family peptidase [Butyrivibrio sp. XPD2006]
MKKKTGIILAVVLVFAVAACACAFVMLRPKSPANPSRRDDAQIAGVSGDEDLEAVVGQDTGSTDTVTKADEAKESTPALTESVVQQNANKPLSDDVEVVSELSLNEAVVMGDGDIGTFYGDEEFKDVVPVDINSFSASDIPSKYDSRDVDGKRYVTAVKDQGYSYLCWTYAAMGACESDILKHHPDIGFNDINLSEKHLAYYNMHEAPGSLAGGIDGDWRVFVNDVGEPDAFVVDADTGYIATGGVTNFVISILSAWKGPVDDTGADSFKSLYGSYYLFTDNTDKPSDAYSGNYHVQSVLQMPSNINNNTLIKQMIMEHGSATVGVCADGKFFKDHSSTLYSTFGGETPATADHEVLIIGWDDDYSASNFKYTPEGDGAWLCRNSWGDGSGQGGCFYLSYYDETTAISNAASYDVVLRDEDDWYDNNYQVGGFITNNVSTLDDALNTAKAYSASSNPYGVLYTAQSDEELKAIGIMAFDLYQQYEISIYIDPVIEGNDLTCGGKEPVLTQKVSAISGGYHTFELDEAIDLKEGDNFFVLVKPHTKGRLAFEKAGETMSDPCYDEWDNLTGNIDNNYTASGQSFYISDDGNSMIRQDDKDFFVKAYTVNK